MPLHCIEYSPAQPSPAQPAREVIRKERKRRSKAGCRSRERGLPNKREKCLRARAEMLSSVLLLGKRPRYQEQSDRVRNPSLRRFFTEELTTMMHALRRALSVTLFSLVLVGKGSFRKSSMGTYLYLYILLYSPTHTLTKKKNIHPFADNHQYPAPPTPLHLPSKSISANRKYLSIYIFVILPHPHPLTKT